ncbi:BPI fold-containing family B member 6 [Grus japonensis]|uniref:BPI fold-containing family B member 6 n=1 Tax=Grus japonensis TaxID=30415 RepID=A0ABC9XJX4_GRUJA
MAQELSSGSILERLTGAKSERSPSPSDIAGALTGFGALHGCLSPNDLHWEKLCPAVDAVLNLVNAKFTTMASEIPLGTAGTLQYTLLNPPMTSETFIELDLKISKVLPPSQPLVIEMREAKAPVMSITPDKSFVQLFSTAEFQVSPLDSAPESLFVLDVHSNLEVQFAIEDEKLQLSLALQR